MGLARCWGVAESGEAVEVAVKPHLVNALQDRWPPFGLRRHDRAPERVIARFGLSDTWMIVPDVEPSGDTPPAIAWDLLESELGLFAVKRLAKLVPVHAAAIAKGGRVLMVPGSSGAGKSTLAVAAAEAGATVLSDEFTLINPTTGLVSGWARPVRIKRNDGVDRLDLAKPSGPLPVGLVAFVTHQRGADDHWSEIPRSEAVVELLSHTISTRTRPEDTFDAALAVVRSARSVAGIRGDASTAVASLLELLDATTG